MNTAWYVVKVLPGKERSLTEQFNKDIGMSRISNVLRFICPTEKEIIVVKNKKVIREKVLYSGYLYFEAPKQLEEDDLKIISLLPNIMGMMGDRMPTMLRENDIKRIIKDEVLENHIESKRLKFINGERIVVSEGPFASFEGTISEIKGEKVDIEVKIFGRNTTVSLTLEQIEKL
jgi:transcriptional antiterminator NusG